MFFKSSTLGAIFAQISTDFARIFTESKLLEVRLQPLHTRLLTSGPASAKSGPGFTERI